MAVFSISKGPNGYEASVGGVSCGSEIDASQFRGPAGKSTPLGSAFQTAHDFAQVSQDMGLGGRTPRIDNSFKM